MRALPWSALALLIFKAQALPVPAELEGELRWDAQEGPYQIIDEVRLLEGARLEIEAGCRVELAPGALFVIQGELIARGRAEAPILFTGSAEAPWNSIRFEPEAVSAEFQALDEYQRGSILEHCIFEHAERALHLLDSAPFIHESLFRENHAPVTLDLRGGAAITIEEGAAPRIMGCRFERNVADLAGYGGAIYIRASDPIIQGNDFRENESVYGGALAADLMASPIVGNHFEGNRATATKGGALALISSVSALLNNEIRGNRAKLDGGGVHICVDCYPHATPSVMDNLIIDNLSENEDPRKGAAGFGAAFLRVFAYNSLLGNLRAGQPSDFGWYHHEEEGYPPWVSERSIAQNWWGERGSHEIAEAIFDGEDAEGYHRVSFEPLLEEAPSPQPRLLLATRKLQYRDAEDPMPFFLTLYNPGAARSLELRILIQYEDLPPVPWRAALEFPGARWEEGGLRLEMPAAAVFFQQLLQPDYPGRAEFSWGLWHGALFDPESGARIGDLHSLRFDLLEAQP